MKRKQEQPSILIPVNDDFYEARYNAPMSKILKAFQLLEQYCLQQRKRQIAIYTNDKQMKNLLEKAYPNITITMVEGMLNERDFV